MPTGYTSKIADGIEFEEFILSCAKAFGACISMRDEPSDVPISDEFVADSYYSDHLEEANKHLSKLNKMSKSECEVRAKSDYEEELALLNEGLKKGVELKAKYEAMLAKVEKWEPPTEDHNGLKEFMAKQITDSIEWDCGDYYEDAIAKLVPLNGGEWRGKGIDKCLEDISYYSKKKNEEDERVADRNMWVRKLRESI